jgi:predicted 3-demethylubiquinone-9 3-methyltransferase (glyoxalase superfamily)
MELILITPFLMFIGENFGKAAEAVDFYTRIFPNSRVTDTENKKFRLNELELMIFENDFPHAFTFSPAISFFVNCDTQDQIDEYWEQLSSHGEEQMCGWLKDQYGISWQIIPADFDHYMLDKNETRRKRVMDALLAMRKIDIQILQNAYNQD